MLKTRVIPSLLIKNRGLIKTVRFNDETYLGDPINAIKIYNDKEVDELVIFDILATKRKFIDLSYISKINKEAFMPLAYGGGIRTIEDISKIIALGYEKIVLNSCALDNPDIIDQAASICGSQSVVICIDVKKDWLGKYRVYKHSSRKNTGKDVVQWAEEVEKRGAGEIILYNIDKEGTYSGYDINLISLVSSKVNIPVVALGGASCIDDLKRPVQEGGASAVAAGSIFVFHGPNRAVLITYPEKKVLKELFDQ